MQVRDGSGSQPAPFPELRPCPDRSRPEQACRMEHETRHYCGNVCIRRAVISCGLVAAWMVPVRHLFKNVAQDCRVDESGRRRNAPDRWRSPVVTAQTGRCGRQRRRRADLACGLIESAGHVTLRPTISQPQRAPLAPHGARTKPPACQPCHGAGPARRRGERRHNGDEHAGSGRCELGGGRTPAAAGDSLGLARDPAGPDVGLATAAARREPPQLQVRRRPGGQRRGLPPLPGPPRSDLAAE